MTTASLPYVCAFTDRHGTRRWRFKRAGKTIALEGFPTPAEYEECLAGRKPAKRQAEAERQAPAPVRPATVPKSLGAAWLLYKADLAFSKLKASTQMQTANVAEQFLLAPVAPGARALWRDQPFPEFRRRHVKAILLERQATPHQADRILKFLRRLVLIALDHEWIEPQADPTHKIQWSPEIKGHRAWTAEELAAFEAFHATGSTPRLVYALARYTGTRCSDLAGLTWEQLEAGRFKRQHIKTGIMVNAPILEPLDRELEATERRGDCVLITRYGRPFSWKSLGQRFKDWTRQAGLSDGVTLHGLRTTFAVAVADAGATTSEHQAVMGHKTLQQSEHYTREADRRRGADAAMARLERTMSPAPGGPAAPALRVIAGRG